MGAGIAGVLRRRLKAAQLFSKGVRQLAARLGLGRSRFTPLYRAVIDAELEDIVRTQAFRNPIGLEVKYFATAPEGASSYAQAASRVFGDGPFTIVETGIPTALITAEMRVVVDRRISTALCRRTCCVACPRQRFGIMRQYQDKKQDKKNVGARADILAKVTLYPTAQGGRAGATPGDTFGCLFVVNGANLDCRLLLAGVGALRPGQSVTVPIKFLDADTARNCIGVGTRFFLQEMKSIGEGEVEKLLFD